ncbi:MAG: MnhB domain-containing protein [Lachnospiraceae bacterium]|nr:MnhB domain-containing protein [Lachnospiraceae bacterium]
MSKKVPRESYEKTISFRLKQWLAGTKDPFLDQVEMKPQKAFCETEEEKNRWQAEKQKAVTKIFDKQKNAELHFFRKIYRLVCVIFCVSLVLVLLTGVSYLPPYGHAGNPVNNEVSQRYIENGLQETGAVNIVTGMILDYRAFDTLGESHVLFIATCTVLILLRFDEEKGKKKKWKDGEIASSNMEELCANDRYYEPKNDLILQTVAKILVPPIVIFGIYVILCGHLGPGGGFSGGAIIGAGLILYLNAFGFAKTERFFTARTYKITSFTALACYALCKSYSFYTGANHIESVIPLGTPGAILSSGLIFVLNICVGVVVAGTMYTFYVMFRKGGY